MNSDNFDDIIRRKADSHQASVPADAWDNINKKKKKKPVVIFWWSLSSLLIIAALIIYIHSNKKQNDSFVLNNNNTTNNSLFQTNKTTESKNITTNNSNNKADTSRQNNNINKQVTQDVTAKTLSTSNNTIEQTSQTKASSIITDNSSSAINYASTKKIKYSQQAKFKSTTVNAAIDSDAITKPSDNSNTIDVADNDTEQKKSNKINSQKNDLSKINNDTITTIQKNTTSDFTTKVKETDIGKTNKKDETKKNIANKKTTNHALVLDFSVTPFSPVQHYDQPLYIQRISNHSLYKADSIQTSLQSSVAFSLDIKKGISRKLMIGTGIQYARISENINLSGEQTDTTFIPIQRLQVNGAARFLGNDTIVTTTTGTRNINAVNSYQLFSIPLFINYTFINRPIFSLSLTAGAYFTFAQYQNSIDGKLESVYANGIQAGNETNKLSTDIFGGLRLSWYVSKKYQLFTEPNFRYNLNSYQLKNSFINKNINQAGVSVGVSYKIK